MGTLSSLKVLDLSGNYLLQGGLAAESLKYLCMLQRLDMSYVNISRKFDELVVRIFSGCIRSSLQYLDLSHAQLSGSLPDDAWFGELKELKYLDLSHNSLNGSIPYSLGELSQLETLDMSSNHLEGSIPESLGRLSSLKILDLRNNNLVGTITEAHFANLSHLQELGMASNIRLHFDVSSNWVPPFRLVSVNMGSCRLGPHFPTWLRLNVSVYMLNLSSTGISDILPVSYWSSTVSIDFIDLSNNEIKGKIPNSLTSVKAHVVILRSNSIDVSLPAGFSQVAVLDLSNNSFSGPIPRNISMTMPHLTFLLLSNNKLSGSIPSSLCQLKYLQVLDLSWNNLSGELPICWNNLRFMVVMNLAHNGLVSATSSSLTFPSSLESLHLNNNNFSGKLPKSLRNCTSMVVLDLGDNKFSGNIPSWVSRSMMFLQVLRLRSNMFTGDIPTNLSALGFLQVIDLANNKLIGSIPSDFGDLTAMMFVHKDADNYTSIVGLIENEYYVENLDVVTKGVQHNYDKLLPLVICIDLSENKLSGNMPQGLANLTGLQTLNISGNQLTGEIMQNIGTLRWLETLDLSRNNLSGRIPPLMSKLTSLNHLNLSCNNFSGRIPTGKQFNTFTDSSIYMGNPYLCGTPLETLCEGDSNTTSVRSPPVEGKNDDSHDNVFDTEWLWLAVVLGFISGFWLVCGTLIFRDKWRYAFFRWIDNTCDRLTMLVKDGLSKLSYKTEK